MRLGIPSIEAPHDRNRACIRRPHAEDGARFAIVRDEMGPHLVVHAVVAALVEEVEVLVGQELRRGEGGVRGHRLGGMVTRLVYRKRRASSRLCGVGGRNGKTATPPRLLAGSPKITLFSEGSG